MSRHIHPAITRIQSRLGTAPVVQSLVEYGSPSGQPGRLDRRPALSPDRPPRGAARRVRRRPGAPRERPHLRARLTRSRRRSCRAAPPISIRSTGFRSASRSWTGTRASPGRTTPAPALARGRLLLLLNSDVLPDGPGWLGRCATSTTRRPTSARWARSCCTRTTPSSTPECTSTVCPARRNGSTATTSRACTGACPAANERARCPLVSGACMMVDRAVLRGARRPDRHLRAGRLRGRGLLPAALARGPRELVPARRRALPPRRPVVLARRSGASANRYNMWLHNFVRKDQIEALAIRGLTDNVPGKERGPR